MYLIASLCMFICISLLIYMQIYVYIYVYKCILTCIWSCSILLLPLAQKVAHDSKGTTQNCQMQVQHWPDITTLSISIAS